MTDTVQVGTNYIVKTPGTLGGRARIDGRRIGVSDVANMHIRLGASVDEIVEAYDLTPAQIYAALAYYYDHRAEIDDHLDAEYRYFAEHADEDRKRHDELLERAKERNPELYERIMKARQERGGV